MADIDIVPKHRSNTWIWIVLAIVVIGLVIWATMGRGSATRSGNNLLPGGSPAAMLTVLDASDASFA